MSDLALTFRLAGFQLRSLSRNSRSLVFSVLMPIVLFLLFASVFGKSGDTTHVRGAALAVRTYFLAGIVAYAITVSGYSSLDISLTTQRELGLLKRFRATPMPPWTFIAAQLLHVAAIILVEVAVLLLIGRVVFGIGVSAAGLAEIALYVALGTFAMCALGVALTAYTKTADAAATIGPFSALILSFISGVFIPVDQLPNALVDIGRVFPLAHLAEGLQSAFTGGTGVHVRGENVLVLAIWGVAGVLIAARTFRWEPQGAGRG